MESSSFENLEKKELLNYINQLKKRCDNLEQTNESQSKVIASQTQKLMDYQKKFNDISGSLRLLF